MPRLARLCAPLAALLALAAAPRAARAADFQEQITYDVAPASLANNYIVFPGGDSSIDVGKTSAVPVLIAVGGVPFGTPVTLNLTATAGDPASGAPAIGYTFSVNITAGPGIIIPISVDAAHAKAGNYQLVLKAVDANSGVSSGAPPRGLLVTTPAADFKSLTANTRMTVQLAGTQLLLKAMAPAGNADSPTGAPAHFRMIFHNLGTSTLQITSGSASFLLAPKDVLAADLSTQFDTTATVYDGATGLLEIGYP